MYHYKKATPTTLKAMSHTVLKSSSQRTKHHTMLDEISGRIEVYWEQWMRTTRSQSTKTDEEYIETSQPVKLRGNTSNTQFIKANLVFE